jgi:hypothetical protein
MSWLVVVVALLLALLQSVVHAQSTIDSNQARAYEDFLADLGLLLAECVSIEQR